MAAQLIGEKVDVAADAANKALDDAVKAKSPDVGKLQSRLRRIEEVRTLPNNPAASIAETNRKQMLGKVEELSASGLTDMPSWMVEASRSAAGSGGCGPASPTPCTSTTWARSRMCEATRNTSDRLWLKGC